MLKVIVAGGRNFKDYELLSLKLDELLRNYKHSEIEIVSGTAQGADRLGERYAEERGCALKKMPADWDTFGKSAGYRRNADMANYADSCVCFWDKKSRGTKHMIDLAKDKGIKLRVVYY